nr:ComEA family DNA-binding protein [uncultured Mediterraneibacter sp.]
MRDRFNDTIVKRRLFGTLILTAFLFLAGCSGHSEEEGLEEITLSEESENSGGPDKSENDGGTGEETVQPQGDTVFVYVCGAVNTPGVYELSASARVFEAVESAGGMTADASKDSVNLARTVADGEQIYVPTEEEAAQGTGVETESTVTGTEQSKVNINTASKEELMTLTGIGEAKAGSILKYREEHGAFGSVEELMEIEGIKEGVFNKIKDDITI